MVSLVFVLPLVPFSCLPRRMRQYDKHTGWPVYLVLCHSFEVMWLCEAGEST